MITKTVRLVRSAIFRIFCVGVVSVIVAASLLQPLACALTAQQLKEQANVARERMSKLHSQAEQVSEALNDTRVRLETTKSEIDTIQKDIAQKTEEFKAARARLAKRVAVQYRLGPTSLLSIVLQASDFSDLVSRMYYANKVAQADKSAIDDVKKVSADLSARQQALQTQKREQENLLAQQHRQVSELQTEERAAKNYVASLDAQVAQKIREKEQAEQTAARQAAEAAQQKVFAEIASVAALASAATTSAAPSQNANSASRTESNGTRRRTRSSGSGKGADSGTNGSSSSGQGGSPKNGGVQVAAAGWRNTVVARALALAAARDQYRYEYGAEGPSAFDCSGLTSYCYKQAGIAISHSSGSQSSFCTKSISEAVPGDVMWRPGHVGIYIGNGRSVEALSPSSGLGYGSASSFVRCGSP